MDGRRGGGGRWSSFSFFLSFLFLSFLFLSWNERRKEKEKKIIKKMGVRI